MSSAKRMSSQHEPVRKQIAGIELKSTQNVTAVLKIEKTMYPVGVLALNGNLLRKGEEKLDFSAISHRLLA